MLSEDQKKQRIECCWQQAERFQKEDDEFRRRMITVDETSIHLYKPGKRNSQLHVCGKQLDHNPQRSSKLAPRRKSRCSSLSLTSNEGMILSHADPHGQTISAQYY